MEWLHPRIFSKFLFSSVDRINCLKSMFDWLCLTNSWCPCAVLWAAHQWDNILPRNFQYYRHTRWLEGIPASLLLHSNQVGFFWISCHKRHQKFTFKKLLRARFAQESSSWLTELGFLNVKDWVRILLLSPHGTLMLLSFEQLLELFYTRIGGEIKSVVFNISRGKKSQQPWLVCMRVLCGSRIGTLEMLLFVEREKPLERRQT